MVSFVFSSPAISTHENMIVNAIFINKYKTEAPNMPFA